MSYYNTTSETGKHLDRFKRLAGDQSQRILAYYERLNGNPAAPSQCWQSLFGEDTPLTSVRRSISDLTEAGFLEKTEYKKTGVYGRPEHLWRLKKEPAN